MIVAVKKNGVAYIGVNQQVVTSDAASQDDLLYGKILKVGESYLGLNASESAYLALRRYFQGTTLHVSLSSSSEICEEFFTFQRCFAHSYKRLPIPSDKQYFESLGFQVLIVNPFGIFGVSDDHSVLEYSRFYAEGMWSNCVVGALEVLYEREIPVENIAYFALKAASRLDSRVGAPGIIYRVY